MPSCPFCLIATGEARSRLLFADQDVVAFHDINPQAPVHVLVIPRRHVASLDEAAPDDRDLLGRLMLAAADAARRTGIVESGFRVVTNTGRGAGQSVFHLHLHVLGGRRLGWPPG
jgi:histidine triad (HIT) family protein